MKEEDSGLVLGLIIGLVESFKSTLESYELLVCQSSVHQLCVEFGAGQYRLEGSCIGLACTVFASDDTSYWMQGAKVIGDDGHVYGHAETIRDALCLVLAKYGGLKGNSTKQTKSVKAVRAW